MLSLTWFDNIHFLLLACSLILYTTDIYVQIESCYLTLELNDRMCIIPTYALSLSKI